MIYVTGDIHGDPSRFSTHSFIDQKEMTKDDFVIICGDFGLVWRDCGEERYWLDWLNDKSFTTLFVDGNHENFDRLYNEFEEVEFHGGLTHRIRDSIYHLERGHIFDLCGKSFFAFGGARSHDIEDGILDPGHFPTSDEFRKEYSKFRMQGKMFRVKGVSWWPEELPSNSEMDYGIKNLSLHSNSVDFVVAHCLPQSVAALYSYGKYKPDLLTMYFNDLLSRGLKFTDWYCGHYHTNCDITTDYHILYEKIRRIV